MPLQNTVLQKKLVIFKWGSFLRIVYGSWNLFGSIIFSIGSSMYWSSYLIHLTSFSQIWILNALYFLDKNINSGHSVNSNISSFSKGLHTNISLQIWNYNLYILSIRKMQTSVNLVIKLTHTKEKRAIHIERITV